MDHGRKQTKFRPQAAPFIMPGANNTAVVVTNGIPPPVPTPINWSNISCSPQNLEKLQLLCHSQNELKRDGYVLRSLDPGQIATKLRCLRCGKRGIPKTSPKTVLDDVVTHSGRAHGKDRFVCDKAAGGCGRSGHTVDKCWQLHPELKPPRLAKLPKPPVKSEAPVAATASNRGEGPEDTAATTISPLLTHHKKTKRSKICWYHPDRVDNKHYMCCGRHVSEEGCTEAEEHDFPSAQDADVLANWQYHLTPSPLAFVQPPQTPSQDETHTQTRKTKSKNKKYQALDLRHDSSSPASRSRSPILSTYQRHFRPAIALDCEMGTSTTNETELIRLTAIDFFTRDILIDNLVVPFVPMLHYNTRYSGVTSGAMRQAMHNGTAILGRDRARMALLQYVSPDTVIVVHGGSSDFSALRWIHSECKVVDTCILEGYNISTTTTTTTVGEVNDENGMGKVEGGKSLKNLAKVKLGIDVQVRDRKMGKLGHDSLEDALAARELCLWWMTRIPDA